MKEENISNFDVMSEMVKINNQGIIMGSDLFDNYMVSQGSVLCFGIANKEVGADASIQRQFGMPGKYMLMCFAIDRKEFELTKLKLQDSIQKKFFIRQFYNTIPKNKLDITLRAAFEVFEDKIITEAQLNEFPIIHKKATEVYYASGGKCKPIDYESTYTGHFTPSSSRKNANIYVTTGYWLEVIEVKP